ncbi:inositol monophosphatase family protein [Erwinia amylovora]
MTPEALQQRYLFAREVAEAAAAFAFTFFRQRAQLAVERKEGNMQDLVSRADREVEELIHNRLQQQFPQDGFLGEEGGGTQAGADTLWVVDPIDGTSCFLNGLPTWCVSIAVIIDGEPAIGVICDPNHNEVFHACKGGGAWLNDAPIQVHPGLTLNEGLTGISNSPKMAPEKISGFIQRLLQAEGMFVRSGSGALTTAWVAAGRLIGFYEPRMNAWDALAGVVLVREAGGVSNDFLAGEGLKYGNALLLGNPAIYQQIRALSEHG